MAIKINQEELIKILSNKKSAVLDWNLPTKMENNLRIVSELIFLTKEYINYVHAILSIPAIEDFGRRLDKNYPYMAVLDQFIEELSCNDGVGKPFKGFRGCRFISPVKGEIRVNPEESLERCVAEVKSNVKRLYNEIEHYFLTNPISDLNYVPKIKDPIKWLKSDSFLDMSTDEKSFRLRGGVYRFAKNAKNPKLIIRSLLKNNEIYTNQLERLIPSSGKGNATRTYNQFVRTISTSTKIEEQEIKSIFQFDEKSKKIFIENPPNSYF